MREPGLHQGIVPFPGIDRRLLRAPSQRLQSTGQVVRMVAHPKGHQNDRTNAQERPPIGVKARVQGSCLEDGQYTLPLLTVQAGWAARNRACVQAGQITLVLVELSSPRADGHPTDPQSAGNGSVGELPGREQPSSF